MTASNGLFSGVGSLIAGARGRIAQAAPLVPKIAALEDGLIAQSDYDLKKTSLSLRYRARSGEPLDKTEAALFRRCTGFKRVPKNPVRRLYRLCGRRAGKSRFLSALARTSLYADSSVR